MEDPEAMSCIFVQFDAIENGIAVTKLMQIFSRQANMMDALIAHFADQMRRRRGEAGGGGDNGGGGGGGVAAGEQSVHDGESRADLSTDGLRLVGNESSF